MKDKDIKLFANTDGYECTIVSKAAQTSYSHSASTLDEEEFIKTFFRGYDSAEYLAFQWLANNIDYILRFYTEGDRDKILKDFLNTMRK